MRTITLFSFLLIIIFSGNAQSFELFDFNTSGDFQPKYFTEFNGILIFQAKDADGVELWKTDGTQTGTSKIKDLNPNGSSNPRNFIPFNGVLYFTATGGLWKTDGTEIGTEIVAQVTPEGKLTVSNNLLFFVAGNNTNGKELWKSDGTEAGTEMVKDINPGTSNSLQFNSQIIAYNNEVIFAANNGINGKELWKSDGTEAGTEMIKDINQFGMDGSNPMHFIEYKGKIYFAASDIQNGNELWKTDGTSSGTELVEDNSTDDLSSNPAKFVVYSESLFFQAESDDNKGIEMHRYNLTTNAVQRVVDIYDGSGSGGFSPAIEYNNGLYFTASKPETGIELYVRRNGSTILSEDVTPGSISGAPTAFCNCGDKMYFRAYDGNENALFEFDTTGNATKIKPNSATNEPFFISTPTELFCFKNELYLAGNYTSSGYDLWKYTVNSTLSIKDDKYNSKSIIYYPNPASDKITITSNNSTNINQIAFYTITGKLVLKEDVNHNEITTSIKNLNAGIYIVNIKTESSSFTKRLIVE
ncbi:ELWxxDGT repeat protein [Tenacibaculum sp. 190524A05c]|uniref:ELWxxDGT repeat protein n=1 Tax=Tenacibaculum platacis TaxID=3137852 RepID=UPI0032B1D40F